MYIQPKKICSILNCFFFIFSLHDCLFTGRKLVGVVSTPNSGNVAASEAEKVMPNLLDSQHVATANTSNSESTDHEELVESADHEEVVESVDHEEVVENVEEGDVISAFVLSSILLPEEQTLPPSPSKQNEDLSDLERDGLEYLAGM